MKNDTMVTAPIANSYVVPGTRLVAGEYPGVRPGTPPGESLRRFQAFVDSGIDVFIDLTTPADRLAPYHGEIEALANAAERSVVHERMFIPDMSVCPVDEMRPILDRIDIHLDAGRAVYVHCWGGAGRTGLVIGCWLVRHGRTGDEALAQVGRLFATMAPEKLARHRGWGSPQTEAQRAMVRNWSELSPVRVARSSPRETTSLDRFRGALVGLAVGDALGTTLEFTAPGTFSPISDMVGVGPFGLAPGQWTDDTSMALCLADSLLQTRSFDPADQMWRYVRWRKEGYRSSTGRCFDIGITVRSALAAFERTGEPFSGATDEQSAGNGSLMRLAPVAIRYSSDARLAIELAGESSRTTHGAPAAIDACRYFAGLLVGAMQGTAKDELLSPSWSPLGRQWAADELHPDVARVANGSFRRQPPDIRGGRGWVIDTLEAALWAFASSDDFEQGALLAVNLGGDADTTGAVYGQLTGAFYGLKGIPERWRARITIGDEIRSLADALHELATK